MSVTAFASMASDWPLSRNRSPSGAPFDGPLPDIGGDLSRRISGQADRPHLRSHKSVPYILGSLRQSLSQSHGQSPLSQVANPESGKDTSARSIPSQVHSEAITHRSTIKPETKSEGASPQSALSRSSPTSPSRAEVDQDDDDYDMLVTMDEAEDEKSETSTTTTKTAAERRADKRKMKRFRLTHNQTRFLMSEFARQAHPDAAQRERLSREIPGLSPRQVQVWFQNRRAKLKRLTSDDRDRMMKSRALPEDFDFSHALHSPFTTVVPPNFTSQNDSTPMPSPSMYSPSLSDSGALRALVTHDLGPGDDDGVVSPSSMSSYRAIYTPPASVPESEDMSPISPVGDRISFAHQSYAPATRSSNSFARSGSFSSGIHPHRHIPRLQLHESVSRSRAESLGSPLRTSMSYSTGNGAPNYSTSLVQNVAAVPASIDGARSYSLSAASDARSSACSYMTPMGFQSAAMARPRTNTVTTFPPGLDLHNQYRPMVFNTMQHHIQAHVSPGFQSAPLSVPYDFCYDAAIQNCYTHGYGSTTPATSTISHEAESYYHSEPYPRRIEESLHEGFVASPMADPVMTTTSSSVAIGQSAVDEYLRDGINLQPDYQQTRRRSFTLPNDFQRTN